MTDAQALTRRRPSPYALAAALFGSDAQVGCARVAAADTGALFPSEADAVHSAVAARKLEFAAGRAAARKALGHWVAIPMAEDRAPVWPEGIAASLSHAGGWAVAAVAPEGRLVGVDLELDEPLPREVFDTVLTASEAAWVRDQTEPDIWARVIFSAKECAYKAQYPKSKQVFGFEVFEVTLDVAVGCFTAVFQTDVAPFSMGDALQGRFSRSDGFILTGITQ